MRLHKRNSTHPHCVVQKQFLVNIWRKKKQKRCKHTAIAIGVEINVGVWWLTTSFRINNFQHGCLLIRSKSAHFIGLFCYSSVKPASKQFLTTDFYGPCLKPMRYVVKNNEILIRFFLSTEGEHRSEHSLINYDEYLPLSWCHQTKRHVKHKTMMFYYTAIN